MESGGKVMKGRGGKERKGWKVIIGLFVWGEVVVVVVVVLRLR